VVAVTVAADSPEQLESVRATFRSWRERLATLLSTGGVPEKRARALAAMLISACEGAVVLARTERAFEPLDLVAQELMAAVCAAMAGESNP
jgi:hypothetical protein